MLHMVPQKMLELGGGGHRPINPLPNPSCSESVVTQGEPRPSIAKVDEARVTNEVSKLPEVNIVYILPTSHLLMRSNYTVEVPSNKRQKALHKQPGDLGPEHPSLSVLGARINVREKSSATGLLRDN